jgi:hypothetical protein
MVDFIDPLKHGASTRSASSCVLPNRGNAAELSDWEVGGIEFVMIWICLCSGRCLRRRKTLSAVKIDRRAVIVLVLVCRTERRERK